VSNVVAGEGSVVTLDGIRIGIANIWERDYVADGEPRHGPTAMLHFPDETTVVAGAGTVIGSWRVAAVTAGDPRGSVEFEPCASPI
jgi:hypothetical protein